MTKKTKPLWLGEEDKPPAEIAIEYTAGQDVILDQELVQYDIATLEAHILMLNKIGLVNKKITKKILKSLEKIKELDNKGEFKLKKELEDVHSNIEQFVINDAGIENGGWLRLGIARNDQIYADTRMYTRSNIIVLVKELIELVNSMIDVASKHKETVMPGYTHLRISQPITFAHWLMAGVDAFIDDIENLQFTYSKVNKNPLGIVEMAGTHLPLDRKFTQELLGFEGISENSLYTANSRGEIEIQLLSDLSLLMVHVRRIVQTLIIWSTYEFGMVGIADGYTTGGTAQPNLKNPDTLEIMKANCTKIYSKLFQTISMMDTLPYGYNRDTQETKPALFEAIKITKQTIPILKGIIETLKVNKKRMLELSEKNFSTAPDVVTQISVKSGVDFRSCYKVVKKLIKDGYLNESFKELTSELMKKVSKGAIGKEIMVKQEDLDGVMGARKSPLTHTSLGGPAPKEVERMIENRKMKIDAHEKKLYENASKIKKSQEKLQSAIKQILKQTS